MRRLFTLAAHSAPLMIASPMAHADSGDPAGRVFQALANAPTCTFATMDEDPGRTRAAARIIAIYECAGGSSLVLLATGPYPAPNSATTAAYRVLDRRTIPASGANKAMLTRGNCTVGRRTLTTSGVLVADWAGRATISGKRIAQFWTVSPDRTHLVPLPTKGMACHQDEP